MAMVAYAPVPSVPPAPIASVVPSVAVRVSVLDAVKVFPAPRVKVPVPVVIVLPLIEVAKAAPRLGVTNVGEVEYTKLVLAVPVVPAADVR